MTKEINLEVNFTHTKATSSTSISSNQSQKIQYWSDKEERKLVWKLDLTIVLFLMFSFFTLQLDRSNISNAITDNLTKDIGITTDQARNGNQIQIAAIVVMEIPSNIIIQKFGSFNWLILQTILWGLVAIFQCFIQNKNSYFATRWLLGMFEAGFIPGSIYYISRFYKRKEMSKRTILFYFGNYFGAAVGSLIAAGILKINNKNGWSSWRYLFLIEGCITIFGTILLATFVPKSIENPVPLHGKWKYFSDREVSIISDRLALADDNNVEKDTVPITFSNIIQSIFHWRNWLHCILNFITIVPYGGLQFFTPKIVKSLGFHKTKANALASIGSFGLCVLSLFFSILSDHFGEKGIFIFIACCYSIIFSGVLKSMEIGHTKKWTMFAIITLVNSGAGTTQALNNSWISVNSKNYMDRCVGLAMAVMGANLGGITGQSLFKDKDAPTYKPAFLAILCMYAGSIVWVLLVMGIYYYLNKRGTTNLLDDSKLEKQEVNESSLKWKYQL